ncbi:MAG: LLM class flavin-dependent oxidoreductase [Gammaproteobacteria bacterium]
MSLELSCAFATSLDTPEHTRIAEQLGYKRAWYYDSPALYPDVWVQLCRAAEKTQKIGLASGVLVPHLRHPMANAAAIATLVDAAGEERVTIGIGTGFTACVAMGQRPLTWSYLKRYVAVLRRLLAGEEAEWDGSVIRMMHWPGYAAARPINVPFVFAAGGPKGIAASKEMAQGVFGVAAGIPDFDWSVVLTLGTVLDEGEDPGNPRVLDAAGHGGAVLFHYAIEHNMLEMIVGGEQWLESYRSVPEKTKHLTMHDGHLVGINDHDRPFVTGEMLAANGVAMDAGAWRERLAALEEQGATEIAYQPAGSDIPRELETFASLIR